MSEDSDNELSFADAHENDVCYQKYKLILERCEKIQYSNERLVFRLQQVKSIIKRRYEDIQILKERLRIEHNEHWDEIPRQFDESAESEEEQNIEDIKPIMLIPKEEPQDPVAGEEKPQKRKGAKRKRLREKDPNAPKRPSNPFFQFCQDQRQNLMEQLQQELKPGEVEPSKQELTRQLAIKWKGMSIDDKKMYVDMYEKSKEKYVIELSEYKQIKNSLSESATTTNSNPPQN